MSKFKDYAGTISKLRSSIATEVEAMMEPIGELNCTGMGVGISTIDNGNVDVTTIYYDSIGRNVSVKDETGVCHDLSDLNTDDMNAMYEHVYYRCDEKIVS